MMTKLLYLGELSSAHTCIYELFANTFFNITMQEADLALLEANN